MNPEMIYHVHKHVIPAALDLLPGRMDSFEARAMLIAIGLQESGFDYRHQIPVAYARGFWQFEKNGALGSLLEDKAIASILTPVLHTLCYPPNLDQIFNAIEHNDILACVFARLLLYKVPASLPVEKESFIGWNQYLGAWHPGKPHHETWDANFAEGWRTVTQE